MLYAKKVAKHLDEHSTNFHVGFQGSWDKHLAFVGLFSQETDIPIRRTVQKIARD